MRPISRISSLLAATLFVSASAGAAAPARLHTYHCLQACPEGAPGNVDIVVREIYTLAADPLTKMSVWVAYRITPETIGPSQSRKWAVDPWLDADDTLEPSDYNGGSEALDIDRGHQAPLAAFSGTTHWQDTNVLSNITPQSKSLNEGSWQRLEARETKLSKEAKRAVHVLTGPLFETMKAPLPGADERHRVPSGYWKLVMLEDGRMTAFIFPQETPRNASYCSYRVALDEVELRARLFLLPARRTPPLPLDSELGC